MLYLLKKKTSSIGKEIEKIEKAHIGRLMYKFFESSKNIDDLSIGFHQKKLANENQLKTTKKVKKNIKC